VEPLSVVIVALIVAASAYIQGRQRRNDRIEDRQYQADTKAAADALEEKRTAEAAANKRATDEVAAQASRAADLLVESNERQEAQAAVVAVGLVDLKADVKDVHTLVNNNLTVVKRALLAQLKINRDQKLAHGDTPTDEEAAAISDLEMEMANREAQAETVAESIAAKEGA
jgi:hypothetical protein